MTGKEGFDVTNYADNNFSDRHDFIDYFIVSFQQISMKIFFSRYEAGCYYYYNFS